MASTATAPAQCDAINRAAINRANAQQSTGPRTEAGKQRSALNALTHGLTCRTAVLPSEDPAAYEQHRRQFLEEYRPATPTETAFVEELADTSWRLKRIPLLEADLLSRALSPAPSPEPPSFDIVDAHRLLATLGIHGHRLSRQFHKTSNTSARFSSNAASASTRSSRKPPPSSNSTNTKDFPTTPTRMASFFQKK